MNVNICNEGGGMVLQLVKYSDSFVKQKLR